MACTRKKQCLYGDICLTARSDKYNLISDEYNLIDASCYKPLGQTNEEWFATLTTEEKAEFLSNSGMFESCNEALFWLREKHEDDN